MGDENNKLDSHRVDTPFQEERQTISNPLKPNKKIIAALTTHQKKLSLNDYIDILQEINDNQPKAVQDMTEYNV